MILKRALFGVLSGIFILLVSLGISNEAQVPCAVTLQGRWSLGEVEVQVIWNNPDKPALVAITNEAAQAPAKVISDGQENVLAAGNKMVVLAKSVSVKRSSEGGGVLAAGEFPNLRCGQVFWTYPTPYPIRLLAKACSGCTAGRQLRVLVFKADVQIADVTTTIFPPDWQEVYKGEATKLVLHCYEAGLEFYRIVESFATGTFMLNLTLP